MNTCTPEFERLARVVGGIDCRHTGLITLRNPFGLGSWTMTLIEAVLVVGAAAGLTHAVRWKRATGDATNLVVWWSSIVALLLIEPVTYFPQWFGLEKKLGITFIHNQFSVQFLYNRLPIYIIAMYPAFTYLAFMLVRRAGIIDRERPAIAAAAVAFVFFAFFEVIDQVGPQWKWWIWNYRIGTGRPTFGVVPYASLDGFSLGIPFALAFVSIVVCRRRQSVVRNIALTSLGVWPVMFVATAPSVLLDLLGLSTKNARFVGTWLVMIAITAVTELAFGRAFRGHCTQATPARSDRFVLISSVVYLATCVAVWAAALPSYFDAVGGRTSDGGYTGSLPVAIVVAVICAVLLVAEETLARQGLPEMSSSPAEASRPEPVAAK